MTRALFAVLTASSAALVCAVAFRSKVVAALRTRVPVLAVSTESPDDVRWTVAPPEHVRSALSEDTKQILEEAWAADEELVEFAQRGGVHFAQPMVQTLESGLELHHSLSWAEGGGLPAINAESDPKLWSSRRPGVLLLHTAVGPQDLWLRWRA